MNDPTLRGCLAVCVLLAACDSGGGEPAGSQPDLYVVQRGSLRISVREQGEIRALRETRVRSEVEGQATIIFLVPEGTRVEQGQKLVELDASELQDREANQAISVERAEAALVNAQQNVKILEKEIEAEEGNAKSRLEIATLNLQKYLGEYRDARAADDGAVGGGTNREMLNALRELVAGTEFAGLNDGVIDLLGADNLDRDMGNLAQQVLDQIDKIRRGRADLKLKEDQLEHSKRLAAKDYITRNELDQHQLAYDSQKSQVQLAWNQLDLLINYELRSEKITLELAVDNARLELDKVRASAEARRAREAAELRSKQSEYGLAKERLDNLRNQIAHAVIYAPTPGLVVYAEVGDGRRSREVVEEGMSVRERQSLIVLPDISKMMAELKVPEADVDKVVVGQLAMVQVDAFPDKPFPARVTRVSPLPDSGSRWSNTNKKVYETEVLLDGENDVLRPGMSSTIEVVIGEIHDVLSVPLQAVRRQGKVHYVWKVGAEGPVAQRVGIGRNNLTHVEITEGLTDGDTVLLAPPSSFDAPVFEQPPEPEADPAPVEPAPVNGDAPPAVLPAPTGDEPEPQRPRRQVSPEMTEYLELVKSKLPQHAAALEERGFRALGDEAVSAAIDADPELSAARDAMREAMRSRRGSRNRGDTGAEAPRTTTDGR